MGDKFADKIFKIGYSQPAFICSKLTIEQEQGVKYVQS